MNKVQNDYIIKYLNNKLLIRNNIDLQIAMCSISSNLEIKDQMKLFPIIQINDNKIIVISDTHFGSKYENYNYINMVYEFALENNINVIIHGGDLMQGSVKPRLNINENINDQIKHFINKYPYSKDINNYICLGNHDSSILSNYELLKIIELRDDINILGFKKVYLNWCNYLLSISHHLSKQKIEIPRLETIIKFCGHRHEFFIKDSYVFLPTLSDDIKYYCNNDNYPGFILGVINNDLIQIYLYQFINDRLNNNGLSLERKLNERAIIK